MANEDGKRAFIAQRVSRELVDGTVANLGIGLPTLCAQYLPQGVSVLFQAENGMIGMGPRGCGDDDSRCLDAGGNQVSIVPGGCFFDSFTSFGIIRGGHVHTTVLGALQVDQEGNLASWIVPGKMVSGMGGAMDLVVGASRVIVAMEHVTKDGKPKIMKRCGLPLTAAGEVDLIVTDMAVIERTAEGLVVREIAQGVTLEDVRKATDAELLVPREPALMTV
jgi:acetate CoA/acetoacetate CoA-transferase beta subunit